MFPFTTNHLGHLLEKNRPELNKSYTQQRSESRKRVLTDLVDSSPHVSRLEILYVWNASYLTPLVLTGCHSEPHHVTSHMLYLWDTIIKMTRLGERWTITAVRYVVKVIIIPSANIHCSQKVIKSLLKWEFIIVLKMSKAVKPGYNTPLVHCAQ